MVKGQGHSKPSKVYAVGGYTRSLIIALRMNEGLHFNIALPIDLIAFIYVVSYLLTAMAQIISVYTCSARDPDGVDG